MEHKNYDFGGYATRNDVRCTDGRTIKKDAFIEQDGTRVPLLWNHDHDDIDNVLGHADLENRPDGVFAYCTLNDSKNADLARVCIKHGDIEALSIWAGHLKQNDSRDVLHGVIGEVSLVHRGANPGAYIEDVMMHSDDDGIEEAIIYSGSEIEIRHADDLKTESKEESKEESKDESKDESKEESKEESKDESKTNNKTIADIINGLSEDEKTAVYALIGQILEDTADNNKDSEGGSTNMKHNIFESEQSENQETLSHTDFCGALSDAKKSRMSLKNTIEHKFGSDTLSHSVVDDEGNTVTYGMANIDYLFPDAREVNREPEFIRRDMSWVDKVMGGAKHLPFSRIRTTQADITMDEARAKGYVKGHKKTEEVFKLLRRHTDPTTIYKKQKLDRDDIIDITDFNVVAWLKTEMRMMLNEEIARAALVGDGRIGGTDDKISEDSIRPIWTDDELYSVHKVVELAAEATEDDVAKEFIKAAIKSRKDYKGTGNPTLFTTEDMLTNCLMLNDTTGRPLYESVDKLKTAIRVSDIVTVEPMEGLTREVRGSQHTLMGIIVNMADYSFGADKGGAVNMFDDFDIDFNQEKYLIETRCSGALTKVHSALVIESKPSGVGA